MFYFCDRPLGSQYVKDIVLQGELILSKGRCPSLLSVFHKLKIKLVQCQQISCGFKRGDFLNYRVEREKKIGVTASAERKKNNCFFFSHT